MPERPTRRSLIEAGLAVGAAGALGPAGLAFASAPGRLPTPGQIEGPFYPSRAELGRHYPDARDHDLVQIAGQPGRADGLQIYIVGHLVDHAGQPVGGAVIETWQTCHRGRYLHPEDDFGQNIPVDPSFQYFGRATADAEGRYAFRTVMPRAYPSGASREWWRPPHVHFKVSVGGRIRLTTQLYFDDPTDPDNPWKHRAVQAKDRLLSKVAEDRRHELVCVLDLAERDPALEAWLAGCGLELHLEPEDRRWGAPRSGRFDLCVRTPPR